jgi:hypothetical protein
LAGSRIAVEVDDGVEFAAVADPLVDLDAHLVLRRRVVALEGSLERRQRRADDRKVVRVRACDELAVARLSCVAAGAAAGAVAAGSGASSATSKSGERRAQRLSKFMARSSSAAR